MLEAGLVFFFAFPWARQSTSSSSDALSQSGEPSQSWSFSIHFLIPLHWNWLGGHDSVRGSNTKASRLVETPYQQKIKELEECYLYNANVKSLKVLYSCGKSFLREKVRTLQDLPRKSKTQVLKKVVSMLEAGNRHRTISKTHHR